VRFTKVFTSPLQRAKRTCELAGFGAVAVIDPDLIEWNYGEYEGRITADIHRERPDWQLFRDGCPGGESPYDVAIRADRAVQRVRAVEGNVLIFFKRAFSPRTRRSLARPRRYARQILCAEHREPECIGLRTQPV